MSNSGQVFEYSSLHIDNQLLQFVICVFPISLGICEYSCKHVGIRANLNQARNRDLCTHDFGFSISSFDST